VGIRVSGRRRRACALEKVAGDVLRLAGGDGGAYGVQKTSSGSGVWSRGWIASCSEVEMRLGLLRAVVCLGWSCLLRFAAS
jgi:hypothetical protein